MASITSIASRRPISTNEARVTCALLEYEDRKKINVATNNFHRCELDFGALHMTYREFEQAANSFFLRIGAGIDDTRMSRQQNSDVVDVYIRSEFREQARQTMVDAYKAAKAQLTTAQGMSV